VTAVSFDILGRDKASQAFDKVGRAADRTEKKFGFLAARSHGLTAGIAAGFGKILPAMAAIASVQVFKGFIDDARESRKVAALTEQIIKSTGGAAKITANQVGDLATAISNKTGVDDEAVQSGANLLLTFKNVRNEVGKGANIFDRATQAAVDLSAAGFGDVNSASKMLGKALNDPLKGLTALGRAGVTFTKQQQEQIKKLVETGDILQAQKIILKEVESQVGGAAAAAGDPIEKLGVIIGNVKETIGTAFLPIVDKAATWLGDRLPGAVDRAGEFFKNNLLGPLKTATGFITDTVVPGFMGLWNLLVKHDFSKQFKQAFHVQEDSGIVSFLLKINEGARTAFANAKKLGSGIISGLTAGLKTGDWSKLGSTLGDGLIAGLKGAGSVIDSIGSAVGDLIDRIDWGKLGSNINTAIRDMLKSVDWKGIGTALGGAIVNLFQKATDLGEKIRGAFKDLMGKVDWKQIGRDSTDAIGQFVSGVDWGKVSKTVALAVIKSLKVEKNVYDTIVNSVGLLVQGMAEEVGKAVGKWFASAGRWLYGKGKELVDGLKSGAAEQSAGIGAWLSSRIVAPVVGAFKDAGKWLVQHGKNLLEGFKNGVVTAAKGIDDWMMRAPVAHILAPWYGAIKWLVGPGKNMITGFLAGVANAAKNIANWLGRNVINPVVGAFSKAGSWLVNQGKNLVAGFLNGVSAIARGIGRWISANVISPVVTPFSRAGYWLVNQGKNLVAGLKNGVVSIASTIGRFMYDRVAVPAVRAFGKAGTWLNRAGRDLIGGLTSGIASRMKGIGSWIKSNVVDPVVSAVKKFFGIRSPSTVMAGIGHNLVAGLLKGLATTSGTAIAKKVFGDMPSALRSIVGKGLISVANLPGKALDALGSAVGIGAPLGGPSGNASNEGIVRTLAGQYGWATGNQWASLRALIMGESGFRNTAQNPTSSAYGLFQFLDSTWGTVGASKTSDPWQQTIAGLKYIARSYGSPANAYSKWLSRSPHWYGDGGLITETVLGVGLKSGKKYGFGERGTEVVTPMHKIPRATGRTQVVLRVESGGSRMDDLLVELIRRYVRVNGGDVQTVLGR